MMQRIEGIQYLRAIMSVFVVCWHMGGGGHSLIFTANYPQHVFTLSDFVNFHLFMLAVPAFIFISTYLFALQGADSPRLWKRLKRLTILLTFWTTAFILFNNGYMGLRYLIPQSVGYFVLTVLQAGSTIYYFFVCLIICLLLTWCIARWRNQWLWAGFLCTVVLLAVLPPLTERTGFFPLSAYWSPLNFLAYPFVAVLFVRYRHVVEEKRAMLFWSAMACSVLFALFEWNSAMGEIYFSRQGFALPPYTRPSLVFGVAAVAAAALHPAIRATPVITFMARYALALYCLHIFFYPIVWNILGKWTQSSFILTYGSIGVVILWCYLLAVLLKNYLQQDVLM